MHHIVSGCPVHAKTRQNKAAAYLHWIICQYYKIISSVKWYEHQLPTVTDTDEASILWDMPIHNDRQLKANKPEIGAKDKKKGRRMIIIDMAVPSESSTSVKVTEKLTNLIKHKDLGIEESRMRDMKAGTIPVVVGALQ